jgi:predicted phosphodiesterase
VLRLVDAVGCPPAERRVITRFGVVGDVHAEAEALAIALDHFEAERVDAVLVVGDIVDGAGDASACCALLEQRGAQAVRGNHDRWYLAAAMRDLPDATALGSLDAGAEQLLRHLPATRTFDTPVGPLLLCHGLGEDDMATVKPDDGAYDLENNDALARLVRSRFRLVVCGHSHRRMVRRFGGVTIINAGTLARHHDPCFGVVDLESHTTTFFAPERQGVRALEVSAIP